jgi:hypothetical protein
MVKRPGEVIGMAFLPQFFEDRKLMRSVDLKPLPDFHAAFDDDTKRTSEKGVGRLDIVADRRDIRLPVILDPDHARSEPLGMMNTKMETGAAEGDATSNKTVTELQKYGLDLQLVSHA